MHLCTRSCGETVRMALEGMPAAGEQFHPLYNCAVADGRAGACCYQPVNTNESRHQCTLLFLR